MIAQNNAIRTKDIKAKIDKSHQNRCTLSSNREEIINHIISECNKLTQKMYKTRHDRVEELIYWELRKFKFEDTNKCYILNTVSVMVNETYTLLCDLRYKPITLSRPDDHT